MERKLTRRSLLQGAATIGMGLSLPSFSAGARKKATLRFNWTAKGEFTPFYVAQEMGFFKEQDLDVELNEGKSGTQAVQVVGTGSDTFADGPSIQVGQRIHHGVPPKWCRTVRRADAM